MNIRLATYQIAVFSRPQQWVIECLVNGASIQREVYEKARWDSPTDALHAFCARLEVDTPRHS